MEQKEKEALSRPVLITGAVVPLAIGVMAIVGNILTARLQPSSDPTTLPTSPAGNQLENTTANSGDKSDNEGEISVDAGNTATVLNGKVFIALLRTESKTEPTQQIAYGTLSSDDRGVRDWHLEGVVAGYSCTFNNFRVRVMSVEANSARFRVTPLSSPTTTAPSEEPTSESRH